MSPVPGPPPPPILTTVLDILSSSLRLIGVLASGEQPSASQQADGLRVVNDLWDQWNAEQLMIFTIPRVLFDLTSGKQVYTYGTGGDFDADRPPAIERMGILWLQNQNQPLELPLDYFTAQSWSQIPVKNIESSLPQYCWDDQAFPLRNLSFWPIPNISALQVVIYPRLALPQPITLTTLMAFPPGYLKAWRFNLAVDLAAEYPVVPPQVLAPVAQQAIEAKAIIKTMNTQPIDLACDPATTPLGGDYLYNWISDTPAGR